MKNQTSCEAIKQKLSNAQWSKEDQKAFTDLFALLLEMELDQQNDVVKGYADDVTNK